MSLYNPTMDMLNHLRTVNFIIGLIACVSLCVLMKPKWHGWNVPTKLGWLALFWLCFTGTYGTLEIKYLETYFRVPMTTVSLVWATIAALWPFYERYKAYRAAKKQDQVEEPG